MLKEFGFKVIDRLNISASTSNICSPLLIVSPSGNLLASVNQKCQPTIFNMSTREIQNQTIKNPLKALEFTADDRFILYATPYSIIEYDISLQKENLIVGAQKSLQTDISLTSLTFSDDFRTLFYVNRSALYSLSRVKKSASPELLIEATSNCTISDYKIYSKSSVITSSKKCFLCKWDLINGTFTPSSQLDLNQFYSNNNNDGCTLNKLAFDGTYIYVTREINVNNKVDILVVNPHELTLNKIVSKRITFPQASSLVFYQNYILTCLTNLRNIWINRDSLDTSTSQFSSTDLTIIKAAAYNPHKNEVYQYWYSWLRLADTHLAISQLTFDCTKVNGSTTNSSSLQADCSCQPQYVFNKQALICQRSPCLSTPDPISCPCPAGYRRNKFNWNCVLDCQSIENALPTMAFGNPYQCHCTYPYKWQNNQCFLDCALIPNALSVGLKEKCSCNVGFKWNPQTRQCLNQYLPITPQTPKEPDYQAHKPLAPYQVATIIITTLSLVIIIIYIALYCKFRKRILKNRQIKIQQALKSDRPPLSARPLGVELQTMASDEKLSEERQKKGEDCKRQQNKQIDLRNIDNFSITDDEEDEHRHEELNDDANNAENLSGIQSKMEQPLND